VTGLVGDRVSLAAGLSWSLVPAALGLGLTALVGLAQLRVDRPAPRGHDPRNRFQ